MTTVQASDPRFVLLQNLNLQEIQDAIFHGNNGAPTKDDLKPLILKQLKSADQNLPNADQVADWLAGYISKRFDPNSAESKADDNGSPEIPSLSGNPNDKGALSKLGNWMRDILGDAQKYLKEKNVSDDQNDPNDVANDAVANALIGNKDDPNDGALDKIQKSFDDLFNPDQHSIEDIQDLLDKWLKQNPYTGRPSNEQSGTNQSTEQDQGGGTPGSGGTTGGGGTPGATGGTQPSGGTTPAADLGAVPGPTGAQPTAGTELFQNWPSNANQIVEGLKGIEMPKMPPGVSPESEEGKTVIKQREAIINGVFDKFNLSPDEKTFFMRMARAEGTTSLDKLDHDGGANKGLLSAAKSGFEGNPSPYEKLTGQKPPEGWQQILDNPEKNYAAAIGLGLMNLRANAMSGKGGHDSAFTAAVVQHQKGYANIEMSNPEDQGLIRLHLAMEQPDDSPALKRFYQELRSLPH